MNSRTETLLRTYKAKLAIMVYTSAGTGWNDAYLESHEVLENGNIAQGSPLRQETIQGLVDVFFDERKNSADITGFFPEHLLNYESLPGGYYSLMWWRPAQLQQMFFAPSLKIPSGQAQVPALIFYVERKTLYVFALDADQRPTLKTPLHRAPFHNVDGTGSVCLGNASIKKPTDRTFENTMKYWEDLFWRSEFSHLNGATSPTKSDLSVLWRRLMKSKRLTWKSLKELKKSKVTIQSLFE